MYVNCQGALAIKIWPGIFILKNCEVHQNQKNGTKQPNGYILSAYQFGATWNENGQNKRHELFTVRAFWLGHYLIFIVCVKLKFSNRTYPIRPLTNDF